MKIKNLETILPILGFNGDVQVSNNMDLTIGFKLQLPEVLSCSTGQLYALHDTFQRMTGLLPAGSFLHKQDFFLANYIQSGKQSGKDRGDRTDNYPKPEGWGIENSRAKGPEANSLNNCYMQHFEGRSYLKHDCHIYISLLNKGLLKNYLESSLILS